MTYDIIATGSSGNAVVINGEILIDCGVPYKTLEKSGYIKTLKLVLLTHEHGDHFKPSTVKRLHQERPALRWCCCDWMVPPLLKAGVDKRAIDVARLTRSEQTSQALIYNNLAIVDPEPLVHDAPNCGWRISAGGEWLFYATDTGSLDHLEIPNYNYYLIEANHTRAELEARIAEKQTRGEYAYEYRAAANHLSREQALDWLAQNAGANSQYVFLHQHYQKDGEYSENI